MKEKWLVVQEFAKLKTFYVFFKLVINLLTYFFLLITSNTIAINSLSGE